MTTEEHNKQLENTYDRLVGKLAECALPLAIVERREKMPDFFGQVYNRLCMEAYEALANKKVDKFKLVFAPTFLGAIQAQDRLRTSLKDRGPEVLISYSVEPLLDILELSGFAKIYAELWQTSEFWNICERTWNKYLQEGVKNKNHVIEFLVQIHKYRKGQLRLYSRDVWRGNWQIDLNRRMASAGLVRDRFFNEYVRDEDATPTHQSALIRVLSRYGWASAIDSVEVFIITYLKPQYSGRMTFDDRHDLTEQIKKEEERYGKKPGEN